MILLLLTLLCTSASAYNFLDQGFTSGYASTDYLSPLYVQTITIDRSSCNWRGNDPIAIQLKSASTIDEAICPSGPLTYSGKLVQGGGLWIVSANVEPSFATTTVANQGPPSFSDNTNGSPHVFNLSITQGSSGSIANLWVQLSDILSGATWTDGIPFLSIGAHNGRGGQGPVGALNNAAAPSRTHFISRLNWISTTPVAAHYVVAVSSWGGVQRGIFLALHHVNIESNHWNQLVMHSHWNWPVTDSFWFPGVDWTFIDAEDVQPECGITVPRIQQVNVDYSYTIDWQVMLQCLSSFFDTPMPLNQELPIIGVHWATEATGSHGVVWTSVRDMKMMQ